MSNFVIADSSAFVSLATVTDSNHESVTKISHEIYKTDKYIIVPADIFTETVNILGKKSDHNIALGTAREILQTKEITIVETTAALRLNALSKFRNQPKSVSFTDCIVMAVADEYKTKEIFGFDEAFQRNGYIRIGIDNQK